MWPFTRARRANPAAKSAHRRWIEADHHDACHEFHRIRAPGDCPGRDAGCGSCRGIGADPRGAAWPCVSASKKLVTIVIVFSGILSNAASEAGYVILIPLAGIIFHAFGRHPLAGMAAAFAGVSGGYSANLVLGTIDPLLSGITEEMAGIIDVHYKVNPAANYYFMIASTFHLTLPGTWITHRIVEPRLGKYNDDVESVPVDHLKPEEKKGLKVAGLSILCPGCGVCSEIQE